MNTRQLPTATRHDHRALVCAPLMPEFDRQGGQLRTWHLVESLLEAGWSVTFVSNSGSLEDRYARMLQQSGVATYAAPSPELVDQLVRSGKFDIAFLLYWNVAEQYLPHIRTVSPRTRVVVDSVDLHFVRNARRQLRRTPDGSARVLGPDFGSQMVRELNAYAAADAVLTVSEKEASLINDLVMDATLAYSVPDADVFEPSLLPRADRRGILCLANFAYTPNVEAFAYLCQQILPRVDPAVLAAHPLQVVGNALDEQTRRYVRELENVQLVGWVPSVVPYFETACISVIPLLHGAGTKRKLIQALMIGTPTVTTSVGAEGLNVRDGEHVLVADSPAEFAAAIERLVTHVDLWESIEEAGRRLVLQAHGRKAVRARFLEMLTMVLTKQAKSMASAAEQAARTLAGA